MRETVSQPYFAGLLNPCADKRETLPEKEKSIIAVPQRPKKE